MSSNVAEILVAGHVEGRRGGGHAKPKFLMLFKVSSPSTKRHCHGPGGHRLLAVAAEEQ